jgi:hypothetical protein
LIQCSNVRNNIITKFISYCRPLGPRILLCPEQDPGLDKQLQISNVNIKRCKYIQLVTTRIHANILGPTYKDKERYNRQNSVSLKMHIFCTVIN